MPEPLLGAHFERVVVVVSAGRTGTTSLARYLDATYTNVRALHEPRPSYRLRICSCAHLAGRITQHRMRSAFLHARRRLCARISEPIFIEVNPLLYGFVDVLPQVYRDPVLIHIVRDPRTSVPSAANFGTDRGFKRLVSRLVPFWVPKPEQNPQTRQYRRSQMSELQWLAWVWRSINEYVDNAACAYGDSFRRIRFEDLFDANGDTMRELASWLGLERDSTSASSLANYRMNASRRLVAPPWQDWPAEERNWLLDQCGPLMEKFGYPLQ